MFCIVKVCVRPGTGDLKSKFMTILEGDLLTFVFEKIVGELSAEAALLVGDLQRVTLLLGTIEAEPECTNDAAGKYFSMDLKSITFVVSQRATATAARRTNHPVDLLTRESMASGLPEWSDLGHAAYSTLFQKLRGVLEADACFFRDLEQGTIAHGANPAPASRPRPTLPAAETPPPPPQPGALNSPGPGQETAPRRILCVMPLPRQLLGRLRPTDRPTD
ncbi:hypothetical protein M885DRAFT_24211 [Pelagophyceae sp. CCMP2097]|nr:hypothetical protein M885DRAFT_24211 [Pelagophyceae sp. CCMP2097]